MIRKFYIPDSQIILSERFLRVERVFTELRSLRGFIRNFADNSKYVGLNFVSVFIDKSDTLERWDITFIYSSKWLNSRSLSRFNVSPKSLYFTSRIELI